MHYPHGTYGAYRKDNCKCLPCRSAGTRYETRRRQAIKNGTWDGHNVPSGPARDHLRRLRQAGMTWDTIAAPTGYLRQTLQRIAHGRQKVIRRHTETAILAIRVPTRLPDHGRVPALGTIRRIRALHTLGWTCAAIGNHTPDVTGSQLADILTGAQKTVYVTTHRAIAKAYRDLSSMEADTTPRAKSRAKNLAARNAWPRPIDWDDDEIDDPRAQPHIAQGSPDRREQVRAMFNAGATDQQIKDDLGFNTLSAVRGMRARLGLTRHSKEDAA